MKKLNKDEIMEFLKKNKKKILVTVATTIGGVVLCKIMGKHIFRDETVLIIDETAIAGHDVDGNGLLSAVETIKEVSSDVANDLLEKAET